MIKFIKILPLFFSMTLSMSASGQNVIDSGTINLLKESYKNDQTNTVLSGMSIVFATNMLANGAQGNALNELEVFLGTTVENKNIELQEQLVNLPKTLEISNSIWGNHFNLSYQTLLQNVMGASAHQLPGHTDVINNWIADQTHNKITHLLDSNPTKSNELYLINTVYFKDVWEEKFNTNRTSNEAFYTLSGQKQDVPMMHENFDALEYAENSKLQSVKLPYKNNGFMIIFLPKEDISFDEFVSTLTPEDLNLEYTRKEVDLSLPKFKIDKRTDVKQLFQSLEVNEIFRKDTTDLIGLLKNTQNKAYVSQIAHKAIVEVDEGGTTAAAATSVGILRATSFSRPIEVKANRPFVFFITVGDFIGFYTGNDLQE